MSVSPRSPFQRHQTAAHQHLAGLDPEVFSAFKVGQRVMTRDGLPGVVEAVLDGPYPSTEAYEVVLDGGMGGGTYGPSDLTSMGEKISATASLDDEDEEGSTAHVASEDYPELADILVRRPPLEDSIAVSASLHLAEWVVVDSGGNVVESGFSDSFTAADARDEHIAADGGTYNVEQRTSDTSAFQDTFSGDGPEGDLLDIEDYPSATFASVTPVTITSGVLDRVVDKINDHMPDSVRDDGKGRWSYDWCRYRREEHCFFPKDINYEASKQAGYIVWIPVDRGFCMRSDWNAQKACPVGEPGPHSGDPNALVDATIPWEEGGFREAALASDDKAIVQEAVSDDTFRFHFTAAWSDIQEKAKRIRSEGGVRILSVTDDQVTGDVQGDEGVYQTTLIREPGKQAVAMWECGCPWATYSWARSGRWKKYEGRMCSHALALNYEIQARGWRGGEVHEDPEAPEWDTGAKVPGDRELPAEWQRGKPRAASVVAMAPIKADPSIEEIVAWYAAHAKEEEPRLTKIIGDLAGHNGGKTEGLQFRFKKPEKIQEKIHRKHLTSGDPRMWIDDALRYTVVFHPAIYSAQVQDTLYGLQEAGYRIIEESNTWPKGDSYSDLQYVIETPSGLHAEIQFHTGESLELKQRTLHKMYEEFRDSRTPLRRKQQLFDLMAKFWDKVQIPKDVLEFPVLRMYPRPASLDPSLRRSLASAIKEARSGGVLVRVRGRILELLALLPGGKVKVEGDQVVPANQVVHPKYDPRKGLDYKPPFPLHSSIHEADITFTDEGLYEMLGELALPPWDDQHGGYLGGDLDCAPMAEHIQERVEQTRIAQADTEAMLHDEPEPALPTAVGAEEPDDIDAMVRQALGVNASLTGQSAAPLAPGLAWLMDGAQGPQAAADSSDIAAAAAAFLDTGKVPEPGLQATAARTFSPAEQMQIINEGKGVRAGNLDLLEIQGTHYEAIASLDDDDDNLW